MTALFGSFSDFASAFQKAIKTFLNYRIKDLEGNDEENLINQLLFFFSDKDRRTGTGLSLSENGREFDKESSRHVQERAFDEKNFTFSHFNDRLLVGSSLVLFDCFIPTLPKIWTASWGAHATGW